MAMNTSIKDCQKKEWGYGYAKNILTIFTFNQIKPTSIYTY